MDHRWLPETVTTINELQWGISILDKRRYLLVGNTTLRSDKQLKGLNVGIVRLRLRFLKKVSQKAIFHLFNKVPEPLGMQKRICTAEIFVDGRLVGLLQKDHFYTINNFI